LHWSRQYANTFRGPWALVQGARRATELDARLDTSLGAIYAILYSMLDAGHYVIFDALLDAVLNPGLEIQGFRAARLDVKLNSVLRVIMGIYGYCEVRGSSILP